MDKRLTEILDSIDREFQKIVEKGARHYLEVSIGRQAEKLGYLDLGKKYKSTYAVVPLKAPRSGMKVRIDGRTFVNYAEYDSGIAVPGYLSREAGRSFKTFIPNDSMICNFA
jgi:hypothetical protein